MQVSSPHECVEREGERRRRREKMEKHCYPHPCSFLQSLLRACVRCFGLWAHEDLPPSESGGLSVKDKPKEAPNQGEGTRIYSSISTPSPTSLVLLQQNESVSIALSRDPDRKPPNPGEGGKVH